MELPEKEKLYEEIKPTSGTLLELLMQPVNKKFVETHDDYKDYQYLPIDKVEWLLSKLFGSTYNVEILREGFALGSAYMSVRVHFFNPDTKKPDFWDGSAACEVTKGTNGTSPKAALPIAKSDAIKDACGIWPLFGSELNRNKPKAEKVDVDKKLQDLYNEKLPLVIASKISQEEKDGLKRIVEKKEREDYDKAFKFLNELKHHQK